MLCDARHDLEFGNHTPNEKRLAGDASLLGLASFFLFPLGFRFLQIFLHAELRDFFDQPIRDGPVKRKLYRTFGALINGQFFLERLRPAWRGIKPNISSSRKGLNMVKRGSVEGDQSPCPSPQPRLPEQFVPSKC